MTTKTPWGRDDNCNGPRRSEPGKGDDCDIYALGRADKFADSCVPSYGRISAGMWKSRNEDFADTIWPVVVKVKLEVTDYELVQHLRDLANRIEEKYSPPPPGYGPGPKRSAKVYDLTGKLL
jgi:hypothetical protein